LPIAIGSGLKLALFLVGRVVGITWLARRHWHGDFLRGSDGQLQSEPDSKERGLFLEQRPRKHRAWYVPAQRGFIGFADCREFLRMSFGAMTPNRRSVGTLDFGLGCPRADPKKLPAIDRHVRTASRGD
jgi:hypothetical protein